MSDTHTAQYPHQDAAPVIAADVTVYHVRGEEGQKFWRVLVTRPMAGAADETTTRDYLAWDKYAAQGYLAHEAATDLLGIVLTS